MQSIHHVTVSVGSDKSSLDSVDTDLQVLVIKSFGHFLKKYIVDSDPSTATVMEDSINCSSLPPDTNSFALVKLIYQQKER